jgi:hypothetical protein
MIVFVALALLFQPFSKVPLGRHGWIIVDEFMARGLVVSIFVKKMSR